MRKWTWLVAAVAVTLFGVLIWIYQTGFLYTTKAEEAQTHSWVLVRACEGYRKHLKGDGKYPATLTELVEPDPKSGRKAMVEGGLVSLLDPWGEQYRYAIVETKDGPVPYVWAEREIDGRLHLIGARLAAGEARTFGPNRR